jgi:hypothetical protein
MRRRPHMRRAASRARVAAGRFERRVTRGAAGRFERRVTRGVV